MTMEIVVPGELLSDKPIYSGSTYIEGGKTYATVVGMLDDGRYTPLEGTYKSKLDDTVVGIVYDINPRGYTIDVNSSDRGMISSRDIRDKLEKGDIVFGKVGSFSTYGDVVIFAPKKLSRGRVFKVKTSKVPRIIGKKSSMVNVIKEGTNTQIVIGNNGYIWVGGSGDIALVGKAFDEIVNNAHKKGLTDYITKFIEKNKQDTQTNNEN